MGRVVVKGDLRLEGDVFDTFGPEEYACAVCGAKTLRAATFRARLERTRQGVNRTCGFDVRFACTWEHAHEALRQMLGEAGVSASASHREQQ